MRASYLSVLLTAGMVKRVRGVAYSMKVSPQNANRMVDGARGPLNDYLADVYIFTDSMSGEHAHTHHTHTHTHTHIEQGHQLRTGAACSEQTRACGMASLVIR